MVVGVEGPITNRGFLDFVWLGEGVVGLGLGLRLGLGVGLGLMLLLGLGLGFCLRRVGEGEREGEDGVFVKKDVI